MKEKLTDAKWREEVTKEVQSNAVAGLMLRELEVDINLSDLAPTPDEAKKHGCYVKPAGKSRNRFVYLLVRGVLIVEIVLALLDLFDQSNREAILIPSTPIFVQQVSENLSNGEYLALVTNERPVDSLVLIKSSWATNPTVYGVDLQHLHEGEIDSLRATDIVALPVSGSMPSVRVATNSLSTIMGSLS